jgi:hypothetical protein
MVKELPVFKTTISKQFGNLDFKRPPCLTARVWPEKLFLEKAVFPAKPLLSNKNCIIYYRPI